MCVKQSLRLDGKKVCNIKMVGISQAESNNIKAYALPSIQLPLTREARMWCKARGCCPFSMVVGMEVLGATGGASSSPTKSEKDGAVLEGLVGAKAV